MNATTKTGKRFDTIGTVKYWFTYQDANNSFRKEFKSEAMRDRALAKFLAR